MKKNLLLLLILLASSAYNSFGSHLIGCELSYQYVAPNTYTVTLKNYQECGVGINVPTTGVNISSSGCNPVRTVTLNQVSQQVVNPYGSQIAASCAYEIYTYTGTITFTTAEQACPDWKLSVVANARTETANGLGMGDMYSEAFLKLGNNINNNSPVFDDQNPAIPFVNYNQPIVTSMSAYDQDGDSLYYRLVAPLVAAGTPNAYAPLNYSAGILLNPNDSTQFAFLPGGPWQFTPTFPLLSWNVNWNMPAPRYAAKYFILDSLNGSLAFCPRFYDTNIVGPGKNKYLVSIQVDEFRKINGKVTKIGSVRRETMIWVINGGANANPLLTGMKANNQPLSTGSEIRLRPGTPLTLQFTATDPNAANAVQMTSNVSAILPGATFSVTSGNHPTGTITWTPTAANVRQQPYYINVLLKDDANPLRGIHVETFALRVSNTGGVTGTSKEHLAANTDFIAYPNPFSQEMSFKLNLKNSTQTILIYNALGQEVDRISLSGKDIGEQNIRWEKASRFAAGTYIARLVGEGASVQTIKFSKMQ